MAISSHQQTANKNLHLTVRRYASREIKSMKSTSSSEIKSNMFAVNIFSSLVKLTICGTLIYFFEYGFYIVIGYILFSIEKISSLVYLNANEANEHLNNVNNNSEKSIELRHRLTEMEEKNSDLELRVIELEIKSEASDEEGF